MKKQKVIIIGAGPAGLTAAYSLLSQSKEYDVTIIEETNDIGGISKTVKYKNNKMDIGGHRFFSKNDEVNKFWNNIMPIQGQKSYDDKILERNITLKEGGPDPEKENNVMLIRKRVSRIYYLNKFYDYPITLKKETFTNLGLKTTIQSGFSYIKSTIYKRKENSLEDFYINRFGKKLYSIFFEKYTEKLWGRNPNIISPDFGKQRVKGLSIKEIFKDIFHLKRKETETSLIKEFYYPKYGPGQFWERVAEEIEKLGGKIILNSKVIKINSKNNKITSIIYDNNKIKKEINGDIFISSMPLKDLINSFSAKTPTKIKKIASGLPYRDFITIGLLVKKLNLKNTTNIKTIGNIIPDCWIYVQDANIKLGRIQIFNNWSPYLVNDIENTVWIGLEYFCTENDDFWNLSEEECAKVAIKELVEMGIINNDDVIDYHQEKIKKAYPAYFDTYNEIHKLRTYLNKFDNLYCIGRNGQHRYNNMDHSMMTAFETVKNILNNIKSKDNIWNVNVEKSYHEEKDS